MARELVYYPDPRLGEVSKPIQQVDGELKALIREMFEVMYQSKGIGLAGPQIGFSYRIVVANLTGKKEDEQIFINPKIVEKREEMREEEGCLSLPSLVAQILRSKSVVVDVTDLDGKKKRFEADGLYAKLFQHEIDHLDGILIIDKMTPAQKRSYAPLLAELEKDYKEKKKRQYPINEIAAL